MLNFYFVRFNKNVSNKNLNWSLISTFEFNFNSKKISSDVRRSNCKLYRDVDRGLQISMEYFRSSRKHSFSNVVLWDGTICLMI